jgi:hypothetical protein
MSMAPRFLPLLLIAFAGICLAPGGPQQAPTSKPPPLVLDEDEPLLLDAPRQPADRANTKTKPAADNTACLVCHANFKNEALASSHATQGLACTNCHGPSVAHRNDEANVIPPDVMFPTAAIDEACARCHDSHDVEPRVVIQRFLERSPGKTDIKSLVCTQCHGEHRLAVRTVRWDKQTGKLLTLEQKRSNHGDREEKTINHRDHRGHGEKTTEKRQKNTERGRGNGQDGR